MPRIIQEANPSIWYVVLAYRYEGSNIKGIFTTKDKAIEYCELFIKYSELERSSKKFKKQSETNWSCESDDSNLFIRCVLKNGALDDLKKRYAEILEEKKTICLSLK